MYSGSIDGMRMTEILNSIQLDFFDHYLKGKPVRDEMIAGFPEVVERKVP